MKKFKYLVLVFIVLFTVTTSSLKATHIFGGDITWDCVGQDSFIITATIYRDCNGINLSNASIPIKCKSTNQTITTINIPKPAPIDITPNCSSSCTRCQSGSCSFPYGIEKYVYSKLVDLSIAGSCCELIISYQMCCRPTIITTGGASKNFYVESMLNRCLTPCDNSPKFSIDPVTVICANEKINLNPGVYDIDRLASGELLDSISYSLTKPRNGNSSYIPYTGGYSYDKPLMFWGFPNKTFPYPRGFHFDASSGDLKFKTTKVQYTIMAIKISEYRNGVLIGEVNRDRSLIIMNCPNNDNPQLLSNSYYKEVLLGDTVSFNILTSDDNINDSLHISWSNNITGANWTDNNDSVKHPSANFTWVPTSQDANCLPFNFYVNVRDNACPLNAISSKAFKVWVRDSISGDVTVQKMGCGKYKLTAQPTGIHQNLKFEWTMPGGVKYFTNPIYYKNYNQGYLHYSLQMTTSYDTFNYSNTIIADTFINVDLPADTALCVGGSLNISSIVNYAQGNISYLWSDSSTTDNINVGPLYKDSLIILNVSDSSNCVSLDSIFIDIHDLEIDLGEDLHFCDYSDGIVEADVDLNSSGYISSYEWYELGNTNVVGSLKQISVSDSGVYYCKAIDNIGCTATDTINVFEISQPNVNAGVDDSICSRDGLIELNGTPSIPSGVWTGTAVVYQNSKYYFNAEDTSIVNAGKYKLNYLYTDIYGCSNEDSLFYTVIHSPTQPIAGSYSNLCINDGLLQLNATPIGGVWSGNGIVTVNNFDPQLAGVGTHKLIYKVENSFCSLCDSTTITVFDLPNVFASTITGETVFCKEYGLIELIASPIGGINGGYWSNNVVNKKYFNTDAPEGNYEVIYYFVDNNGCENSDTILILLGDSKVEIDGNKDFICKGDKADLHAEYEISKRIQWMKADNADGTLYGNTGFKDIKYFPGTNDNLKKWFWIKVKTVDPVCSTVWDSVLINIVDLPVIDFSASPTSGEVPMVVNFTNLSSTDSGSINNYFWKFGNGDTSINQNPVYEYNINGDYDVSLFVSTDLGCENDLMKTKFIEVLKSGIKDSKIATKIKIVPNPAQDKFLILADKNEKINSVIIYNSLGKKVLNFVDVNDSRLTVNAKELPKSIYFIKINLNNDKEYFEQVIIE
ncbi:MAG: PKD domain-containing protein [Bacteroidota bacterium]|nr:PKD domain-containing protein [Bacteroidota bacterium]